MLPGIAAVAFDLDGTLYPNYRLNVRLLPFLLGHWRLLIAFSGARDRIRSEQEESPSSFREDFYDYQAQLTAGRLNAPPHQIREMLERLVYRGFEGHFRKIKLFPHVRELLAELRSAGIKLGLLSDFPPKTKLENLGIAEGWDAVLCSEETGAIKPALRPFACLAEELRCESGEILYVGNSYRYDVLGAKRAGMKTALLAGGGKQGGDADFTFRNYRQLRNYMLQ